MLAEENIQQSPGVIEPRAVAFRLLIAGSVLLVVLRLCVPTPLQAQSSTSQPSGVAVGTDAAQATESTAAQAKAYPWGPVTTNDGSLVNSLPFFLPSTNNAPVFCMP